MAFDLVSMLVGFLAGTATGAAGKYMAERFTDQRHRQEERSQAVDLLALVRAKVPKLVSELQTDLTESPLVREVMILPNRRIQYTHPHNRFVLFEDEHPAARTELAYLASIGYAEQVANGNFPLYRLQETFVTSLIGRG